MTLAWLALLVGLVAVAGSIVFVVVRSLELWRTIRAFLSAIGSGLDEFGRKVDALASSESPELERLEPALARLQRSNAQLAVLRDAVKRVREQTSGALVFYPRK